MVDQVVGPGWIPGHQGSAQGLCCNRGLSEGSWGSSLLRGYIFRVVFCPCWHSLPNLSSCPIPSLWACRPNSFPEASLSVRTVFVISFNVEQHQGGPAIPRMCWKWARSVLSLSPGFCQSWTAGLTLHSARMSMDSNLMKLGLSPSLTLPSLETMDTSHIVFTLWFSHV